MHGVPAYHYSCDEAFTKKMNRQKDVLTEYHDVQTGQLPYDAFARRYDFHYFWGEMDDALYDALASDENYTLIYDYKDPQAEYGARVYRFDLWHDRSVGK